MLHINVLAIIISEACKSKLEMKRQPSISYFQISAPKLSKAKDRINFFHTGSSLSSCLKRYNLSHDSA